MKATAHLLYGFVGAGKTTLAKTLEHDLPAVRFTHDEWVVRLYGHSPPPEKFAEYDQQIAELIWQVAIRVLELGNDIILDRGFWSRASRDDARSRLAAVEATVKLYHVICPEDIMRRRVRSRSRALPLDALWINEPAFELFKSRFEPLGDDEAHIVINGHA